ncbi:mevalonate kinase [Halobacteriales archaeon QS_3_64_16]|nr:MAG: mevalonate kinase [Halobacteriales archaeon QS_3_64_16]
MQTSSAPGKVYLFGEHAVVYGEPAIPCTIERRATVTVEQRSDDRLRVEASDLSLEGFAVEYGGNGSGGKSERSPDIDVPESLLEAATGYIDGAISQAREAARVPEAGFEVSIDSEIPLGAGLGSSAAVVVATIDAASRELGTKLEPRALAERAYQVEYEVQDGQASRADTFCSATGGAVRVEGSECRPIDAPNLPFVIGYDGGTGDTADLVSGVRELREQYSFAADTVGAIGDIVREGERALEAGEIEQVGELMNFDHGLLAALGVSARSLDAMVWAARDAGALGAKLTGAGGGGCIVALDPGEETSQALRYTVDCVETFRAELDAEGARQEDRP